MPGYPPHGHHMGGPPMHHHPSHPMPHANIPRSSRLPTSSNQSNVDKNSRKKDKSKTKSIPVSKSMGNVKPPYVKKSTGVKWTKEEVSIFTLKKYQVSQTIPRNSHTMNLFTHRMTCCVKKSKRMVQRTGNQ